MRRRPFLIATFVLCGALGSAGTALALDLGVETAQITTTESTTTTTTAAPVAASSSLAMTMPASANLSTGISAGGGPLVAALGTVTVVDSGGVVPRTWAATVSSTDFVTGAGASTIPKALVGYASGPATSVSTGAVAVPGQPDVALPVALATPIVAFTGTGATLETSVSWNPTLVVTFPPNLVAGEYQGTITHSVA